MPSNGRSGSTHALNGREELNRMAGGRAVVIHAPKDLRVEERAPAAAMALLERLRIEPT